MRKTTCRLCNSADLASAARFNDMPLVDRYSRAPNSEPLHPCALDMCRACGHIQLSEVIAGEAMFGEYLFRTADYPWLVAHYEAYADSVFREFAPQFVVEIGSNDGTLAKMFADKGCSVLGVDPSDVPSSVPVIRAFFNEKTVQAIARPADLVIANHVFAHNDDLESIVRGVKLLLAENGVFIFETNCGLDLLERHLFDIVYHEHMDYHTVTPLMSFLASIGLTLFRVEHNDSKGGTLKGYVCHAGARPEETSVLIAAQLEGAVGATSPGIFREFNERLEQRRKRLLDQLGTRPFIGYGAAAGGIATLYHMGLAHRCAWIVDDSPRRHGMHAPHSNLVVKPTDTLYCYETHHDFTAVVVLSWRYAEAIKGKHPLLEMIVP